MAEIILLDPSAEAVGRTQLDITAYIDADGVDWGDAAITAAMADSSLGSLPVDYRVPNRTVSIPLILKAIGATTFDTIRQQIQAKAALFQREGGWLSRQTSIGTVYATVVSATLKLGGDWFQANRSFDTTAVLTLECLPDWYGAEITLDDIVETTNSALVSTLKLSAAVANIKGDYPGRLRLVVDDDQAQSQRSLLWGLRCRNYSSATTAKLLYEAETLTALDAAALTTITGASGATNNVIRHNSLSASWTSVLSTQATGGGAHMTHTGTYRVWARVYATNVTNPPNLPSLRLLWDVGDLSFPVENPAWTFPGYLNFYIADLGEVRLDQALQGTHRWQGIIQAKDQLGIGNVSIDQLWFQPIDESAGALIASASDSPVTSYNARDEFNQTVGNLTGKTLPVGGVWTLSGGDTDDYTLDGTNTYAQRATVSDTAPRFIYPSTMSSLAATGASVDVRLTGVPTFTTHYVMIRRVDASNYAYASLAFSGSDLVLSIAKVIAGTTTLLASTFAASAVGQWYTLSAVATVGGGVTATVASQGSSSPRAVIGAYDAVFATAGTLASGRSGIGDYNSGVAAAARNYDNFRAWAATTDAVIFASQSAELRWDGMIREDSAGVAWGAITPSGDLARVPPSGLEGRTVEVFIKPSRGDLATLPDSGIDDVSARAFYRPSWLTVPGP